jgi:hypothetical protein
MATFNSRNEKEGSNLKDWTGNSQAVHAVNQRSQEAQEHDYYATDPKAVELLLKEESFSDWILEPACGEGHIAKVLGEHGYSVIASDLVYRGYGEGGINFLQCDGVLHEDIVTNPPYKYAKEFVLKALSLISDGHKVAMFLKLTFLEGQSRRELFRIFPPKAVYVSSARLECGKNGKFTGSSAVAYCWIVWQKGYSGQTCLKWIN